MSDPIFFAPLKVPVIDSRTGLMSRDWYLFFQAMFLRIGGSSGLTNDDILQSVSQFLGTADVFAAQLTASDAFAQAVGELRAMRDQVAELTKRLDDIQQGTLI